MLATDMLHLHAGVPDCYVQDPPIGSVTGGGVQQLCLDAAQEVAVHAGKMMRKWFETFHLDQILDCRESTGIHSSLLPILFCTMLVNHKC
jgi:hypothetical protein